MRQTQTSVSTYGECREYVSRRLLDPFVMVDFDPRTATDAMAFLVKHAGGSLNYTAGLKILYFAERESLLKYGWTITGGTPCAMRNGLLTSEVYKLIKNEWPSRRWTAHLKTVGFHLELLRESSYDYISEADEEILFDQWSRHKDKCVKLDDRPDALICESHKLPEWVNPGRSRELIPHRRILELEHVPNEIILAYAREAEAARAFPRCRSWED